MPPTGPTLSLLPWQPPSARPPRSAGGPLPPALPLSAQPRPPLWHPPGTEVRPACSFSAWMLAGANQPRAVQASPRLRHASVWAWKSPDRSLCLERLSVDACVVGCGSAWQQGMPSLSRVVLQAVVRCVQRPSHEQLQQMQSS